VRLAAEAGLEAGLDPSVPPVEAELYITNKSVSSFNLLFARKSRGVTILHPGIPRDKIHWQQIFCNHRDFVRLASV